jgi:putative intracellular protease/amidase
MVPIRGRLGAGKKGLATYHQMTHDKAYQHPITYAEINPTEYARIILPGGHAPGMTQYLDCSVLQSKVLDFWKQGKVIGAISHGVMILARTIDPASWKSILDGHKVTALMKSLERTGYFMTIWLFDGRYCTYACHLADEVRGCLENGRDFMSGKSMWIPYLVEDHRLITSR